MSNGHDELIRRLLDENDLLDAAERVGDAMYRLRWGSATVITGAAGTGIVVIAPIFEALPEGKTEDFLRRLLELNRAMGGTASFALQQDGGVVLQVGRGIKGLDSEEFALMLATVGKFADDYDDMLHSEFYK